MSGDRETAENSELAHRGTSELQELSWEQVLARAEPEAARGGPDATAGRRPPSRASLAIKMALPFLVILFYFGMRYLPSAGSPTSQPGLLPPPADSLTGVATAGNDPLKLTDRQRSFIGRLEQHRAAGEWEAMLKATTPESVKAVGDHAVIEGLRLIARVRRGDHDEALANALAGVESRLKPVEKEYGELIHELRLTRVRTMVATLDNNEQLLRATDTFRQLLGDKPRNTDAVLVRIQLAQRYERVGDGMRGDARGVFSDDILLVRQARAFYQQALRWIVDPEQWDRLQPMSPAALPDIERIVEKIRMTNRMIHGPSLPMTSNDSTTWSGRRGDLVHDLPAGAR